MTDEDGQPVNTGGMAFFAGPVAVHQHGLGTPPKDGLRIPFFLHNVPAVRKLGELRGSFVLHTGGHLQSVVLKDTLKRPDGPIADARLDSLGVTVTKKTPVGTPVGMNDPENKVEFHMTAGEHPVVQVEIIDPQGKPLPGGSGFQYRDSINKAMFSSRNKLPEDSQVRLTIHQNPEKIRIRFALKDIDIPWRKAPKQYQPYDLSSTPAAGQQPASSYVPAPVYSPSPSFGLPSSSVPVPPLSVVSGGSRPLAPSLAGAPLVAPPPNAGEMPTLSAQAAAPEVTIVSMQANWNGQFSSLALTLNISGTQLKAADYCRCRLTKAVDDTGADLLRPESNISAFMSGGYSYGQMVQLKLPARKALVIKELSGVLDALVLSRDPEAMLTTTGFVGKPRADVSSPILAANGVTLTIVSKAELDRLLGGTLPMPEQVVGPAAQPAASSVAPTANAPFGSFENSVSVVRSDPQQRVASLDFFDAAGQPIPVRFTTSSPADGACAAQLRNLRVRSETARGGRDAHCPGHAEGDGGRAVFAAERDVALIANSTSR